MDRLPARQHEMLLLIVRHGQPCYCQMPADGSEAMEQLIACGMIIVTEHGDKGLFEVEITAKGRAYATDAPQRASSPSRMRVSELAGLLWLALVAALWLASGYVAHAAVTIAFLAVVWSDLHRMIAGEASRYSHAGKLVVLVVTITLVVTLSVVGVP